jgi:hypothetical protein
LIGQRVAEIGAGFGATSRFLCTGDEAIWVCLEPDHRLAARLIERIRVGDLPSCCKGVTGTIEALRPRSLDTIAYIDVLEHIADDRRELRLALERVVPGAHLIVIAPAHSWLYSPFDRSIGHFRRYSRRALRALTPDGAHLKQLYYLDSVGLLASCANRWLLRREQPAARQLWVWDRLMVPLSRLLDPLLGWRVGKSIVAVWEATDTDALENPPVAEHPAAGPRDS